MQPAAQLVAVLLWLLVHPPRAVEALATTTTIREACQFEGYFHSCDTKRMLSIPPFFVVGTMVSPYPCAFLNVKSRMILNILRVRSLFLSLSLSLSLSL